jgi:hypothetical protein
MLSLNFRKIRVRTDTVTVHSAVLTRGYAMMVE